MPCHVFPSWWSICSFFHDLIPASGRFVERAGRCRRRRRPLARSPPSSWPACLSRSMVAFCLTLSHVMFLLSAWPCSFSQGRPQSLGPMCRQGILSKDPAICPSSRSSLLFDCFPLPKTLLQQPLSQRHTLFLTTRIDDPQTQLILSTCLSPATSYSTIPKQTTQL